MIELELRHAKFRVHADRREVETVFPDGRIAGAQRQVDDITKQDALDLGYTHSTDGVWRSLVEHELLHSVISDTAWQRASRVLLHVAGACWVPYLDRVYEEAVILSAQLWLRTGEVRPVLRDVGSGVRYWRPALERLVRQAMAGA